MRESKSVSGAPPRIASHRIASASIPLHLRTRTAVCARNFFLGLPDGTNKKQSRRPPSDPQATKSNFVKSLFLFGRYFICCKRNFANLAVFVALGRFCRDRTANPGPSYPGISSKSRRQCCTRCPESGMLHTKVRS